MASEQSDLIVRHIRKLAAGRTLTNLADRELLLRFTRRHDETAFETLVGRHGPMVLRLCSRVLGNSHDAEDVFQATFLILARQAGTRRWRDSIANWLYEVAYHLALNARTARARRTAREKHSSPRSAVDPLTEISGRELLSALDEEFVRLPPKLRAPLMLCCLEGCTRDEAAQRLGCSLGSLKNRLERGRERLRARLTRRGLTLSSALVANLLTESAAPAAVPPALLQNTVQSALTIVGAKGAAAVASTSAAVMAQTWLFLTKVKNVAILLALAAGLTTTGIVLGHGLLTAPSTGMPAEHAPIIGDEPKRAPQDGNPRPVEPKPSRVDRFGDPLPEGALFRFGTIRFRHPDGAGALALSPDGRTLATEGAGAIRIWDALTGKQRHLFSFDRRMGGFFAGQEPLTFSPNGRQLLAGSDDGAIFVWDVTSGEQHKISLARGGSVHSICRSPNGGIMAAGTDNGVVVRDEATGSVLWEVKNPAHAPGVPVDDRLIMHLRYSLAVFSPNGESIAIHESAAPNLVRLCESKTGQVLGNIELAARLVRLAFSPDGGKLVVTERDNAVRLYETATGRRIHTWTVKLDNPIENYTSVVAFSPDGKSVAAGATDNRIHLWDITTGRELRTFRGHGWYVTGVAFAPDCRILYSTSWDGTVRRWEVATGKELPAADGYAGGVAIAFAPNGKQLASSSDAPIHIWEATTGRPLGVLEGDPAGTACLAYSSNGRILAMGGGEPTVHLWNAATGKPIRKWSWPKGKDPYTHVESITFSPDNGTLATTVFRANQILLWDVESGQQRGSLSHEMVRGVAFTPDGKTMVSVGWDKALRLWNLPGGKLRKTVFLPGEPNFRKESYRDPRIECLALSPDGRILATSQLDGSNCIWSLATGRVLRQFKGHHSQGRVLAFSPDGLWLACLDKDHAISLVDSRSGQVVLRLTGHQGSVSDLEFSPDGRTLLSGSRDNTALLWSLLPDKPNKLKDVRKLWSDLGSTDAAMAYWAVWRMAEMPDQAVPLLREGLISVQTASEATTRPLILDLDNDSFEKREEATKRLRALGEAAEPALRAALEVPLSAEQKRRLQGLLAGMDDAGASLSEEMNRQLRGIAVLQRIATPQSQEVLERLAHGNPTATLTLQAKASLARLRQRAPREP